MKSKAHKIKQIQTAINTPNIIKLPHKHIILSSNSSTNFIEKTSVSKLLLCSNRRNLPPGSKHIRLCLACQTVENMFTSGGRSYSVMISSLTRRNLPRM